MPNKSSTQFLAMGLKSLVDAGGAWIKESIDETFNDTDEKTVNKDCEVLPNTSGDNRSNE